ncbi:MAG: DUF6089 family protein [Bacteroidales bacterium]|nr:DUF6089 family protein [Bacteroidales bacterium]MCF6341340.1 DUF6089 family protein [Bacteroidales bacterium]
MKRKYLKVLFSGFILMMFSLALHAQKTLEVGLFGGGSYYLGEMNPAIPFVNSQLAYGVLARYNINNRTALKFSYSRGTIKGVDPQPARIVPQDYSFSSAVNDISFVGEFNWWDYFTGSKKSFFTPFIFGGVAYYFSDLNSGISIPFGFGLKYSISERLGLGFEWGMRKTFSDYLDGVNATEYQNGISTGDSDKTATWDWYNFTGVTLTYKFILQNKHKCNNLGF